MIRKCLKVIGTVAAILVGVVAVYVIYLFTTYHRIADNLPLTVEQPAKKGTDVDALAIGTEYTALTYNIGFGAYTPDFSFFMDGGKSSWAKSKDSVLDTVQGAGDLAASLNPDFAMIEEIDLDSPHALEVMDPEQKEQLLEEIELLDGASAEFDQEMVSKGELTPVFFGSALTNFGVETFLEHFLKMTTSPLPRMADSGLVDPMSDDFSAFVFKIQANMNKAHRDRIAFMRICSGKFDASQEVYHVQGDKKMRLLQPQQMMAESRHVVEEAYAGDIIGVFDPGIFSIGDTICTPGKKFAFEGIPTFAPEHFARVRLLDTMKRKQFVKGINQIAQEGAIQIFQELYGNMEEIIVGVVGVLQFDVLKYRLENEYNVEIRLENLPYEHIRWIANKDEIQVDKIVGTSDMKKVTDLKGNPLLLFINAWSVGMTEDRNPDLILTEFSK